MKTRFDLEQDILSLSSVASDLDKLAERILEDEVMMSRDELTNIVMGMSALINLRADAAMHTFEQVFELNGYAPDRIKAQRSTLLCEDNK